MERKILYIQVFLFSCFLSFLIQAKYYWMERYHLYGCRENYLQGFPIICPKSRRQTGIDLHTSLYFAIALAFLLLVIAIPFIYRTKQLKHFLAEDIYLNVWHRIQSLGIKEKTEPMASLLMRIEGTSLEYLKPKTQSLDERWKTLDRHLFLSHLGSSIWSELFLLYIFKQKGLFALLITPFTISILLPLFIPLTTSSFSSFLLSLAGVFFHALPLISGLGVLFMSAAILSHSTNVYLIVFLTLWFFTTFLALITSSLRERKDERNLVTLAYKDELDRYNPFNIPKEASLHTYLYLRGYKGR